MSVKPAFTAALMTSALAGLAVMAPMAMVESGPPPGQPGQGHFEQGYLEQGWSPETREAFHFTPQGSRLLPYEWARALEQPDRDLPFFDEDHVRGLGYIPAPGPSPLNPGGFPIGFAKEPAADADDGPWMGMTCAACHTGEVTIGGRRLVIDGAPSRADFQLFMARLGAALDATLAQPEKFTRFAERVGAADPVGLRGRIEARAAHLRRLAAGNWTPEPYGHGRLDAFGHILNAVAGDALNDTGNYRAPDAPVSYPFLWTAPHQRYAQWNGIAGNPIGRNLGEVLGVFGEASLAGPEAERFRSSALAENLLRLETWVEELKAPPWPAWSVGQPDAVRVERGRALYREHCQACHGGVPYRYTPADENLFGKRFIDVAMIPRHVVGTDSRMLDNFTRRRVETSLFAEAGQPAPEIAAGEFLTKVVGKTVERDFAAREVKEEERAAYFGYRLGRDGAPQPGWMGPPAYKAGPLAGIWATGPFLHNGSVPTLYDLLGPEDERPAVFWTGSTRFDPVKVGFVSEEAGLSAQERARLFRFDTSRPGNSNRGHAYPRGQPLDHEERLDLIAFLKTLEDPDVPR